DDDPRRAASDLWEPVRALCDVVRHGIEQRSPLAAAFLAGKAFVKVGLAARGPGYPAAQVTTTVVTGGAGFLGSHLCEHLLAKGHRVICVDNLETASLENISHMRGDEFVFVNHDVMEPISIDGPVDLVLHLAAIPSPIDYMRLPLLSLQIWELGTPHALRL